MSLALPIQTQSAVDTLTYLGQWSPAPVRLLASLLLKFPLTLLFFYGPGLLGCWGGLDHSNICAQLTGVDSSFWQQHPETCNELVNRHFDSFYVSVCVLGYFAGLAYLTLLLVRRLLG